MELAHELERLDEKDPILAAQAARLVALYQRLWESYVAKNVNSQCLDKKNQSSRMPMLTSWKRNNRQSYIPWNVTSSCPTIKKYTRRLKKALLGSWRIGRNPWSTPQMLASRSKIDQSRTVLLDSYVRVGVELGVWSKWRRIYSVRHKALCAYSVDSDIPFAYQSIHGCMIVDFTVSCSFSTLECLAPCISI